MVLHFLNICRSKNLTELSERKKLELSTMSRSKVFVRQNEQCILFIKLLFYKQKLGNESLPRYSQGSTTQLFSYYRKMYIDLDFLRTKILATF